MKNNLKEYLIEDFDLLIQAWISSGNDSTSQLAESLVTFVLEKLNGEIRESCEICPVCGSTKTYKTDAIHCNHCAITTEI